MQFTLGKTFRYWWPVTVDVPDPENPGAFAPRTLKVLFEPRSQDEAIADQHRIDGITDFLEQMVAERELLASVVKGWDGVVDDDRTPVPFSVEALRAAMQMSWFRIGLHQALNESIQGQKARLGN